MTDAVTGGGDDNDVRVEAGPVEYVAVDDLVSEHTARSGGLDMTHVRALAEVAEDLPPLLVHRASMRVIDGHHRLRAHRLCGEHQVAVRFVGGDDVEAFVLAVRADTTHGLPLPLADRKSAAERLVTQRPTWSNRRIATVTALSPKTVGQCRRRVGGEVSAVVGEDDRLRPTDPAVGRRRAEEILRAEPGLSLRTVARAAGISPETVRSVKARLAAENGPDGPDGPAAAQARPQHPCPAGVVGAAVEVLRHDPAVCHSQAGRALLRILDVRPLRTEQLPAMIGDMPPHSRPQFARAIRECAQAWSELADRCVEGTRAAA